VARAGEGRNFDQSNWARLATRPGRYPGAFVDVIARVESAPLRDVAADPGDSRTYYLLAIETRGADANVLLQYQNATELAGGEYVRVTGRVLGEASGDDGAGGSLSGPAILARTLDVVSAPSLTSEPLVTLPPRAHDRAGVTVTVTGVEIAADETRIHVTVRNTSGRLLHFDEAATRLVQRRTSYTATTSERSGQYPEVPAEIPAAARVSGVLVLPVIPPRRRPIFVQLGGSFSEGSSFSDQADITWTFAWPRAGR
jgi:hypothetical protein